MTGAKDIELELLETFAREGLLYFLFHLRSGSIEDFEEV